MFVLCGEIASGKSSYTKIAASNGYICVNDDDIVSLVHGSNYQFYDKSLKILYKSIENTLVSMSLALGRSIIIDRGLNVSLQGRKRWLALAKSFDAIIEAIVFPRSGVEEHALRRMNSDSRGHDYDYWLKVAAHHDKIYVNPSVEEGFAAVYNITYQEILDGKII